MGVLLESRGRVQVSMNLLDYRRTAVTLVAQRLQDEARRRGARVVEYELVGCAPADALDDWPPELAPIEGLKPSQLLDPSLFPG
jgi:glutamate formiminotransferase